MRSCCVLIFLLALYSTVCTAHPSFKYCELLLDDPVEWTVQPVYLIEIESAGFIVPPGKPIPKLSTGFYVYLLLSTGEILIAPKYDVPQFIATGKGLATHKSLLRMYQKKKRKLPASWVLVGGEFQVLSPFVVDISNRSGNFKSKAKRFRKALRYLEDRGLPIRNWTTKRAINPRRKEDRGHTPESINFDEFKLAMMSDVERSEHGVSLRQLYDRFALLIAETFPGVEGKAAMMKMLEFRRKGVEQTRDERGSQSFYYPLLTGYSRDGLDFGIASLFRKDIPSEFKQPKPDYFYAVPTQIHNILIGAGDEFSEEIKAKWRALANDFGIQ